MKQFLSKLAIISFGIRLGCILITMQGCNLKSDMDERRPASDIEIQATSIVGGTNVQMNSMLAHKVFYLALGVEVVVKNGKAISLTSTGICTATAIDSRILITAAHCVHAINSEKIFVTKRKNPWAQSLDMKDWIRAKNVLIHPKYNHNDVKLGFDVALVLLENELPETSVTKMIQDSKMNSEFSIVAAGYGRTSVLKDSENADISKTSSLLNMVDRNVQNYSADQMHFVINQKDHKGICFGDSGGPALFFDSKLKEHVIIGVASYVSVFPDEKKKIDPEDKLNSCTGQGHYTNILSYEDWLNAVLNEWLPAS